MPTISVAMIIKNEAQDLANCLDTVKDWVDEIIILDSGIFCTLRTASNSINYSYWRI